MAHLVLGPVSVGIYALLNVAGLTALVSTRIYDDIPQAPMYPLVWYEVSEREVRGFGTRGFPEIDLRVHCFSQYQGMKQAQEIVQKVIELLRDQAVTVSGYTQAGRIFYDETSPFFDSMINGVKVKELVAAFRIYAQEN